MSDKTQNAPAVNLDYVTTLELVREIARRHDGMVMSVLPRIGPDITVPRVYLNGGYCTCLGLASKLHEYVDNMLPAGPQQPKAEIP